MEIKNELDSQLFREMNSESDRASAITTVAYLDDKLTDLIEAYLRPDKDTVKRLLKPTGPLGPLQNKADLGYLLGLYTKGTRDDIQLIAGIRNKFAHWAKPVTFGHKDVRLDCERLGIEARIFGENNISSSIPKPWDGKYAKFVFVSSIDMLCGHIIAMTRDPNHPKVVL